MAITKKIVQKADKSFVDDWRNAPKWLSVQFALIFGVILTYVTAYPEEVSKIVESLPDEYRIPLGFVITTVIPIYLRLKQQGGSTTTDSE